jgi:ketosteroid isomerase-like protein
MIRYGAAALAGLMVVGAAQAADLSPTELVNRHMAAAGKGDVDAMMADYADDAVALQASGASQGKPAIRAVFERLFPKPVAGAAPAAGGAPAMKVTRIWVEGNIGFVTWTMGALNGTDEFLVRNGKIAVQAVFISGAPGAPAR